MLNPLHGPIRDGPVADRSAILRASRTDQLYRPPSTPAPLAASVSSSTLITVMTGARHPCFASRRSAIRSGNSSPGCVLREGVKARISQIAFARLLGVSGDLLRYLVSYKSALRGEPSRHVLVGIRRSSKTSRPKSAPLQLKALAKNTPVCNARPHG